MSRALNSVVQLMTGLNLEQKDKGKRNGFILISLYYVLYIRPVALNV